MGSQLEKVKYGIRYFLSRDTRTQFLTRVSKSEFGRSLFEQNPSNFYVPLRSYLDSRFTVKERFDACLQDVESAQLNLAITMPTSYWQVKASLCLSWAHAVFIYK